MGYGDELMATGFARGMAAQGKRMAFGDKASKTIHWTHYSPLIFAGNPNIAAPGSEAASDLVWHPFRRGNRLYNREHGEEKRWVWNYNFRPVPGEVFFTPAELAVGASYGREFIFVEPNVVKHKSVASNKQWPIKHWEWVVRDLLKAGYQVRQPVHIWSEFKLRGVPEIPVRTFREALAVMQHARLVITSEGGIHHGAAAMGKRAVVIFGSFVPPEVTGYPDHANIAEGMPCGRYVQCDHCQQNLLAIKPDRVTQAALQQLKESSI